MNQVSDNSEKRFNDDCYYNTVLLESKNFKVIPSLGSLVEGWLLIVPKIHYLSFGAIREQKLYDEADELLGFTLKIAEREYGDCVVFEHGAANNLSKVGCGVDYAHLHIVPKSINLLEETKNLSPIKLDWIKSQNLSETNKYYKNGLPYLFVQNVEGEKYLTTNSNIPSQLFRKVIASKLGIDELFDWKVNAFSNNITKTIKRLSEYKYCEILEPNCSYES